MKSNFSSPTLNFKYEYNNPYNNLQVKAASKHNTFPEQETRFLCNDAAARIPSFFAAERFLVVSLWKENRGFHGSPIPCQLSVPNGREKKKKRKKIPSVLRKHERRKNKRETLLHGDASTEFTAGWLPGVEEASVVLYWIRSNCLHSSPMRFSLLHHDPSRFSFVPLLFNLQCTKLTVAW